MTITLTGPNDFVRSYELEKLVAAFVKEHSDIALERLDGEEAGYQKIYDALTSLPFLASKKMVIIRSPGANKEFTERAEQLIEDLPESTDLIFIEPKFDKRSSIYKLLKNATDFREFAQLDANSLSKWLADYAKNKGGGMSLSDANFLVSRVGLNQQMLANEIDKLLLYGPTISRANIALLTEPNPQSSVFDLLSAAFNSDKQRLLELYAEQRAQKVEPQQIIAMLAWQFHVLAVIKTAGDRAPDQIAKQSKLNPYVIRKSLTISRRLSLTEIKSLINDLLALDVRLKSESIDADEAIKYFLISMSS